MLRKLFLQVVGQLNYMENLFYIYNDVLKEIHSKIVMERKLLGCFGIFFGIGRFNIRVYYLF